MAPQMRVEVVYGDAKTQVLLKTKVPEGATVATAIKASGLLNQYPELKLTQLSLGMFSKKATLDTVIHEGSRVEIYRPLKIDPKVARRERAKQQD